MNWEAIGAIGEIVGATAVVATLVYLAVQIRNSTRIARSATRQSIAETAMAMGTDLVADRDLATALLADLKNQEVDEVDWTRLMARNYVGMRHYENIHYQYLSGMLEEDEWQGFRRNLKSILKWRSMREYWRNESQYFSDAFRAEVAAAQQESDCENSRMDHAYIAKPGSEA